MCPQLGVKALTYNDLIQAQKEISAHNQQLREQTEQLQKDNRELRSQSLQLVGSRGRAGLEAVVLLGALPRGGEAIARARAPFSRTSLP